MLERLSLVQLCAQAGWMQYVFENSRGCPRSCGGRGGAAPGRRAESGEAAGFSWSRSLRCRCPLRVLPDPKEPLSPRPGRGVGTRVAGPEGGAESDRPSPRPPGLEVGG